MRKLVSVNVGNQRVPTLRSVARGLPTNRDIGLVVPACARKDLYLDGVGRSTRKTGLRGREPSQPCGNNRICRRTSAEPTRRPGGRARHVGKRRQSGGVHDIHADVIRIHEGDTPDSELHLTGDITGKVSGFRAVLRVVLRSDGNSPQRHHTQYTERKYQNCNERFEQEKSVLNSPQDG